MTDPAPVTRSVIGNRQLLDQSFGWDQLGTVRHRVSDCAAGAGLTGNRLQDFVLAVNELASNALRHGGGSGRLRLWLAAGAVHCEVSDSGPGIPVRHLRPTGPPSALATSGRGIWLARRLCDELTIDTGARGTRVLARMGLRTASTQHRAAANP